MEKKDWMSVLRAVSLVTEVGLLITANILVGFYLGYLADNLIKTEYLFKVLGAFIGVCSGFYSVYRLIKKVIGDNK